MNSGHQYYKNIKLKDNFNLTLTAEKKVLEVLQRIGISKAAGIDKISGRFSKDSANFLAKPIAKRCNTSISSGIFPSDWEIAKLKSLYKKGSKTSPENSRPISLLPLTSTVIGKKEVYDEVDTIFYSKIIFCTIINQYLRKTISPTSASLSSMTKY